LISAWIRVDPDDPVLVAALLNRRLLDEAISAFEAAVRASADRITAAATPQVDGAKETAAAFVTRAGEWSAERLKIAAQEAGGDLVERIIPALGDRDLRVLPDAVRF
jgi:hypothetical protein